MVGASGQLASGQLAACKATRITARHAQHAQRERCPACPAQRTSMSNFARSGLNVIAVQFSLALHALMSGLVFLRGFRVQRGVRV